MHQKQSESWFRPWHAVLVGLILALGIAAYSYTVIVKTVTVEPAKIFAENFSGPVSEVSNLTGGGEMSGYYNVWLHFRHSGQNIKMKNDYNFSSKHPLEAIRWFVEKYPNDEALKGAMADYDLKGRTQATSANVRHDWLLRNIKTGDYYFRYWGE